MRNQQKNIKEDMENKLPHFYNRLQQKYGQLQQASNLAQQRGAQRPPALLVKAPLWPGLRVAAPCRRAGVAATAVQHAPV